MTDEEREEIDPELCAEGLRYILQHKGYGFDYAEVAVVVGAIALLRDKDNDDDYPYLHSDEEWKRRVIT